MIKTIKAKENMYLTQNADTESRIFVTAISGVNINDTEWRDATEEEKLAYEKEQEQEAKQELNLI